MSGNTDDEYDEGAEDVFHDARLSQSVYEKHRSEGCDPHFEEITDRLCYANTLGDDSGGLQEGMKLMRNEMIRLRELVSQKEEILESFTQLFGNIRTKEEFQTAFTSRFDTSKDLLQEASSESTEEQSGIVVSLMSKYTELKSQFEGLTSINVAMLIKIFSCEFMIKIINCRLSLLNIGYQVGVGSSTVGYMEVISKSMIPIMDRAVQWGLYQTRKYLKKESVQSNPFSRNVANVAIPILEVGQTLSRKAFEFMVLKIILLDPTLYLNTIEQYIQFHVSGRAQLGCELWDDVSFVTSKLRQLVSLPEGVTRPSEEMTPFDRDVVDDFNIIELEVIQELLTELSSIRGTTRDVLDEVEKVTGGTINDEQMTLLSKVASASEGYIESLNAIKGTIDEGKLLSDEEEATVKTIQVKVKLFQDTLNQVLLNSTAMATATETETETETATENATETETATENATETATATATATGGCRQRRKKARRKQTTRKQTKRKRATSKQKRKRKKRSRQRKKNKTIKKK